jgi:hypothetical protein
LQTGRITIALTLLNLVPVLWILAVGLVVIFVKKKQSLMDFT